jgi:hypothetical protein
MANTVSLCVCGSGDPHFIPTTEAKVLSYLQEAKVDVFASTHTCLPFAQRFGPHGAVINNGSGGMPNFSGQRHGLMTRIARLAESGKGPRDSVYGASVGGLRVDAIPVRYDHDAWMCRFSRNWPPGSAAHASYFERCSHGPAFTARQAARFGFELAAS